MTGDSVPDYLGLLPPSSSLLSKEPVVYLAELLFEHLEISYSTYISTVSLSNSTIFMVVSISSILWFIYFYLRGLHHQLHHALHTVVHRPHLHLHVVHGRLAAHLHQLGLSCAKLMLGLAAI